MKYTIIKNQLTLSVFALVLIVNTTGAFAQNLTSSYFMETSMYRHQLNPALLEKPYIGLLVGQINVGTVGNFGLSNFVYKLRNNPNYDLTTFMSPTVSASQFLGKLDDDNRLQASLNVNLFSVGFKGFKGMNLIELNMRSNLGITLPYELFEFMKTAGEKDKYEMGRIGARNNNYMELALGHSHKIDDAWTVGGKVKFLLGLGYADLEASHLNLTTSGDRWAIDGKAALTAATGAGFTHKADGSVDGLEDLQFSPGLGLGLDMGATYKVKGMKGLTLSAALTDLGFISYGEASMAKSEDNWEFNGFDDPIYTTGSDESSSKLGSQFEAIGEDIEDLFSFQDTGKKSVSAGLGATLTLGAVYEMPFYDKLRAGVVYSHRFDGLYTYSQTMLSLSCRPVPALEASLNTSTTNEGWTMGGMLSVYTKGFNFYIASDRFIGKLSKQQIPLNNSNANLALGICFPLNK